MNINEKYQKKDQMRKVKLLINGEERELLVPSNRTLLEVLRNDLGLKGTKYGCGTGECGSCTVLIEGKAMLSCLTLAADLEGQEVVTIEGLSEGDNIDPIQQSFVDRGAIQCGYCTPGFVLTAKALLEENRNPTEEEVRWYLRGNLCRCTGYAKIVEATIEAGKRMGTIKSFMKKEREI